MLHKHSSLVAVPRLLYDSINESGTTVAIFSTYPPDTKFYLYYFTPPEKPPLAGEIRLRVTSSDASFESGSDLLKLNGQPWSRPLSVLSRYYKPLYEKLREDRFVPDDLDAILSTFQVSSGYPRFNRSQLLYTLNDTSIADFSCTDQFFYVITEQEVELLRFVTPFFERCRGLRTIPYTGAFTNHHLSILLD
jgi:hypothetical protein